MKSLNNYIKESLLDMDEDSPELQQAIVLEKILEYYKEYGGGDHFIVSNHKHTSFYLDDITNHEKYKDLVKDFDSFLKESNIHHQKNAGVNGVLYEFDLGLTISLLFYDDRRNFEFRCVLHSSKNNGLKTFNNGLIKNSKKL
jgi:hypothetical protein